MAHCYTVVNGYGVEFGSETALFLDFGLYNLSDFMEMSMSGDKLSERVDNCDDRLTELFVLHAVCAPESTRAPAIRRPSVLAALFKGKLIIIANL